jgi:hypothetical protein
LHQPGFTTPWIGSPRLLQRRRSSALVVELPILPKIRHLRRTLGRAYRDAYKKFGDAGPPAVG